MSSPYGSFSNPPPPYAASDAPRPSRYASTTVDYASRPLISQIPYHRESDETTTLVNMPKGGRNAKCRTHYMFPLLFILMMASLWMILPMLSSAVRNEMVEWERIHDEMVRDIGRLRVEKGEILDEVQQLRIDRDEQRREWELEREENEKRRRGHVPFWGEARLLNEQCPRDRFRRYEARMYNLLVEDDWYAACMKEPINIAGRTPNSPQSCVNRGLDNGVHGFWSIEVNTRECPRTIWDRLRNIFR